MNSVSSIFVALSIVFGGGYALDRICIAVKRAAVERIQHGMPHLSDFNSRMTCSDITVADGKLIPLKNCGSHRHMKSHQGK